MGQFAFQELRYCSNKGEGLNSLLSLSWTSQVLSEKAIRKAVSAEKPTHKPTKKLHFSQLARSQQPAKRPSLTTSGKSSGCPSSSGLSCDPKASSSSSSHWGKGKKFLRFLASLIATGGRCTRMVLAFLWRRGVDCQGAPTWLCGPFPSFHTCVVGPSGVSVMCFGVRSSVGTPGRGVQDAL